MKPAQILQKAKNKHYAVGQFNVSTDEQIRAIVEIARSLNSPVIIGTSEGEREFIGTNQAVALVNSWRRETKLSLILNADHCKTLESAKKAIDAGYSGVHFDGSNLSLEKNIETTKKVVTYGKNKNPDLLIEGELGYLKGGSEIHDKIEVKLGDLTKPEEAKQFVEKTGVDSLAVVVGNIHGIETDMKKYSFEDLKVDELIQDVISYFENQISAKKINLVTEIEKDIPSLSADRDSLSRALINLLDNALKYAPQSPRIILRVFSRDKSVFFEVEDFGPGILKKEQDKVFNKFYRTDQSHDSSIKGSGIGLTIVDHTARAHGGEVRIKSEKEKGTRVTIEIPIKIKRENHG